MPGYGRKVTDFLYVFIGCRPTVLQNVAGFCMERPARRASDKLAGANNTRVEPPPRPHRICDFYQVLSGWPKAAQPWGLENREKKQVFTGCRLAGGQRVEQLLMHAAKTAVAHHHYMVAGSGGGACLLYTSDAADE